MESEGLNPSGVLTTIKLDSNANTKISWATSKHELAVLDKGVFIAANQAARAWSVALSTTYTGLVVSNPPSSGKNMIILEAGFALTVAPAAIASIGLITGYSSTEVTHTSSLTPINCFVGDPLGKGKADDQATLPAAPVWHKQIMGGFTAGALPSTSPNIIYVEGGIVLPPGGYCGIGALTAVTGLGYLMWKEINV